jgi:HNH endonuclease
MTATEPLPYPDQPHQRKHGPASYTNWSSFKPWLRDEFEFRCVFCRLRETWSPHGADSFAVEHLKPRSRSPELEFAYENLLYACLRCNSHKLDQWPIMDQCRVAYGGHVRVRDDGTIEALTKPGRRMIRLLHLDDEEVNLFRGRLIRLIRHLWTNREKEVAASLYRELMGYPIGLPDLNALRPRDNRRPEGIRSSHFERRRRGELPDVY